MRTSHFTSNTFLHSPSDLFGAKDNSSLWCTITFSSPFLEFIAIYTDKQQAVELIS